MDTYRIVVTNMDKHIVLQHAGPRGWYTCSKPRKPRYDFTDLAVYPNTPANMKRVQTIAGEGTQVVTMVDAYIGPHGTQWVMNADHFASTYSSDIEAVAALAMFA